MTSPTLAGRRARDCRARSGTSIGTLACPTAADARSADGRLVRIRRANARRSSMCGGGLCLLRRRATGRGRGRHQRGATQWPEAGCPAELNPTLRALPRVDRVRSDNAFAEITSAVALSVRHQARLGRLVVVVIGGPTCGATIGLDGSGRRGGGGGSDGGRVGGDGVRRSRLIAGVLSPLRRATRAPSRASPASSMGRAGWAALASPSSGAPSAQRASPVVSGGSSVRALRRVLLPRADPSASSTVRCSSAVAVFIGSPRVGDAGDTGAVVCSVLGGGSSGGAAFPPASYVLFAGISTLRTSGRSGAFVSVFVGFGRFGGAGLGAGTGFLSFTASSLPCLMGAAIRRAPRTSTDLAASEELA